MNILNLVYPTLAKEDTRLRKPVSAELRLALTLRYFATGESYQTLSRGVLFL